MASKVEDVMAAVKLNELLKKKDEEIEAKADKKAVKTILIICGVVVLAAAVAFAIYKFMTPDYLDDFDDDFFDDDDLVEDESASAKA